MPMYLYCDIRLLPYVQNEVAVARFLLQPVFSTKLSLLSRKSSLGLLTQPQCRISLTGAGGSKPNR